MGRLAQQSETEPTISVKTERFFSSRTRRSLDSMLQAFLSMESSSSSTSSNFPSYWTYLNLLLFRPVLAILFVLSFIILWWWLAWKLVLVHVPLVQEIFGLRKKPVNRKPPTRRLSRYYNSINVHNSTSE